MDKGRRFVRPSIPPIPLFLLILLITHCLLDFPYPPSTVTTLHRDNWIHIFMYFSLSLKRQIEGCPAGLASLRRSAVLERRGVGNSMFVAPSQGNPPSHLQTPPRPSCPRSLGTVLCTHRCDQDQGLNYEFALRKRVSCIRILEGGIWKDWVRNENCI